jgi:hypothetical protein
MIITKGYGHNLITQGYGLAAAGISLPALYFFTKNKIVTLFTKDIIVTITVKSKIVTLFTKATIVTTAVKNKIVKYFKVC